MTGLVLVLEHGYGFDFDLSVNNILSQSQSYKTTRQMSSQQGSEDVNDFLVRIKELSDRRDSEDEERNRKLEEEILQGRAERQARRAGIQSHSCTGGAV